MNTHESYVSLETARLLKEAGFDWECLLRYWEDTGKTEWFGNSLIANPYVDDTIAAPTLDVAQRWLRESKDCIVLVWHEDKWEFIDAHYGYEINNEHIDLSNDPDTNEFPTYEQALEAGIQKCLTILLEEK